MKDYKELIKSFTKEDYLNNKVNLHIHTKFSDGRADFEDIIKQARDKSYKYISITDHNTVEGHRKFNDDILIPGVEFDVWYRYIFLHLIAYGIDINHPSMQKFYAKTKSGTEYDILRIIPQRDIKDLINSIHKAGGIAVLAHPACCWAIDMDKFVSDLVNLGLDGMEIYYPYPRWRKYLRFAPIEKIEEIADKYKLIKTGGTDLHELEL